MQNEVEHLKKAGSETPVNIGSEISEAGVVGHHESKEMVEIDNSHGGLLSPSKESVPAQTSHQGLVVIPEPAKQKQEGKPMEDTTWGKVHMAQKLKERFERRRQKGELLNAA